MLASLFMTKLLPEPAYEAYVKSAGIDGSTDFHIDEMYGCPAPPCAGGWDFPSVSAVCMWLAHALYPSSVWPWSVGMWVCTTRLRPCHRHALSLSPSLPPPPSPSLARSLPPPSLLPSLCLSLPLPPPPISLPCRVQSKGAPVSVFAFGQQVHVCAQSREFGV